MFKLNCNIIVGEYRFTGVNEVTVKSGWDELTDTCTIVLPRKINWRGRNIAIGQDSLLRRGQEVVVQLGYDTELNEVFRGFVKNIHAETPVKIECEDAMYNLKKGEFTASYKNVDLQTILEGMSKVQEFEFKLLANRELGQLRISKATPAKVLEELRSKYQVRFFFRAGVLYAGLVADPAQQKTHVFDMELNVVENNLEYRRKEDVRIKLEANILYPNNTIEKLTAGDLDGEQRTLHYYNVPKSDIKMQLDAELERLRYDGYKGSLTTFGRPQVRHGDVAKIRSAVLPERDGSYLVKSVETTFGMGGFRQVLELETKVS